MVSELRGEDEGVDLEQGTGPEESASSSEEKADKERSDEEAERERNEERAERERDDWKTGEERNDEKAERERNDEKTERDRSDEKTETVRSDEKPCGGACSGASEFDESTEREVVSGPFLPLEKSERKQRCFAVKTAREGSAQTPEMVTSRSFVVVTDLEPCTELRIWMVRERASAEPGTGAAGSKAGRTETEKRAAESEQREAEQEGRGREAAGLRAPFAESDWRVAEPRLTETERRELEEEWQTAVGEGMSRLGVTRGAEERVQGERESGVESGVDGTERERNEPLGGAELERNEPLGGMKRERNELLGGTDRERNAGRGVREVTLQAGRLPSGGRLDS